MEGRGYDLPLYATVFLEIRSLDIPNKQVCTFKA